MLRQSDLGDPSFAISKKLYQLIKAGKIRFAGNIPGKIYGRMNCVSGKRMKPANRIFFGSANEAKLASYRPCGHCMRHEYQLWKSKNQQ